MPAHFFFLGCDQKECICVSSHLFGCLDSLARGAEGREELVRTQSAKFCAQFDFSFENQIFTGCSTHLFTYLYSRTLSLTYIIIHSVTQCVSVSCLRKEKLNNILASLQAHDK